MPAQSAIEVDAVFFDAGSTLIYPDPPVGEVYARALAEAGLEAQGRRVEAQFGRAFERARREARADGPGYGRTEAEAKRWWRRIVRESFAPFGEPAAFDEVFERLWRHFASPRAWRLFDDVLPALDALAARGKGLGVISNWDARLPPLLEGLELGRRLDWTVVSYQVDAEKPEGAIFQAALERCGVPARRVAHVGDSYEEDALGALAAGMRAVWLRRADGGAPPPADEVTIVERLTELPALVR